MSIFILKNGIMELSDYIKEEGFNQLLISHEIEGIENNECDNIDLIRYCFTEDRNDDIDKKTIDLCDELNLSYFIFYDNLENDFHIYSSDGIFKTNYETNQILSSQCTGIFSKFQNKNYNLILNEIRNNIPNLGEYDIIITSELNEMN